MQDLIRRYPGVISTRVGYSGGEVRNATYRKHGKHDEAIGLYRRAIAVSEANSDPVEAAMATNNLAVTLRMHKDFLP